MLPGREPVDRRDVGRSEVLDGAEPVAAEVGGEQIRQVAHDQDVGVQVEDPMCIGQQARQEQAVPDRLVYLGPRESGSVNLGNLEPVNRRRWGGSFDAPSCVGREVIVQDDDRIVVKAAERVDRNRERHGERSVGYERNLILPHRSDTRASTGSPCARGRRTRGADPAEIDGALLSLGLPSTTDGQGRLGLVALAPGSYDLYHGKVTSYINLLNAYEAARLTSVTLGMNATVKVEVTLGFEREGPPKRKLSKFSVGSTFLTGIGEGMSPRDSWRGFVNPAPEVKSSGPATGTSPTRVHEALTLR